MFAGPNGSGKSTLKDELQPQWLGVYVNADDIERELLARGNSIDLRAFGIAASEEAVAAFFGQSSLLRKAGLEDTVANLRVEDGVLHFGSIVLTSYHAAVLADFIRRDLVSRNATVSFETVMSSPDKVEFLCEAQRRGYRTYLYFVATEDPDINIARVAMRVKQGGHDVPRDKVVERYQRSLELLVEAIRCANRVYVFDNTCYAGSPQRAALPPSWG